MEPLEKQLTEAYNKLELWVETQLAKATQPPEPQAAVPITPALDPTYLAGLPWRPFEKQEGAWIFSNTEGAKELFNLLTAKRIVTIGDSRYELSGIDDKFINRFSKVGKK